MEPLKMICKVIRRIIDMLLYNLKLNDYGKKEFYF
jgi:hypothetical protein